MFDNLFFIHIPKTGGTYIRKTLAVASCVDYGSPAHLTYNECHHLIQGRIPFTVIRNPYTWIESWYHYEHNRSKRYKRDTNITKHQTFEDFILNKGFLELNPPHTQTQYCAGIDTQNILRQEELHHQLNVFLQRNCINIDVPIEHINVQHNRIPQVWSNKMKDIFLSKYLQDFLNFGYAY